MKHIDSFGIPFDMEGAEHTLCFGEGVQPEDISFKKADAMAHLLYAPLPPQTEERLFYTVYTDIYRPQERALFKAKDLVNGITVMQAGEYSECVKTSGHYHGFNQGHTVPFPEAYEVLSGRACFLLQKSTHFDREEELEVEEFLAVFVDQGQTILVPPFYAHATVNVGDTPLVFGFLSGDCPCDYGPIRSKHGMGYFLLRREGHLIFVPNANYWRLPQLHVAGVREDAALGIEFGMPLYEAYLKHPERFEYMYEPERYQQEMDRLLVRLS